MTAAAARRPGAAPLAPRLIGHRGAAAAAPENTLAGFRKAAELGALWVEFDVRLTADRRVILLHDDRLERTTDGKGAAADLSFAEIRRLDAGRWFGEGFAGERVPSLEETIELLEGLGLGAVVELKPARGAETETGERAARLLAERWPRSLPPPMLSSFRTAALAAARAAAPQIARALLVGTLPQDWRDTVAALGLTAIHIDQRRLTPVVLAPLADAGLPVFAYTVNEPTRARELLAWGVSALFTDCPDRLLRALGPPAPAEPRGEAGGSGRRQARI